MVVSVGSVGRVHGLVHINDDCFEETEEDALVLPDRVLLSKASGAPVAWTKVEGFRGRLARR